MRHLHAVAFAILAVLVVVSVPAFAQTDVMPLDQVKPGMTGYGIGPIGGQNKGRFEFRVIDIERESGTLPFITVEIFRDKKHESESGLVMTGMSGSPLYIGGRCIGAISRMPTSPEDLTVIYLMPAEHFMAPPPQGTLTDDADLLPLGAAVPWSPGDSYEYCTVWGDVNRCTGAVISTVDGAILHGQAHETKTTGDDETAREIDEGVVRLPAWKADVVGYIGGTDYSTVISHSVGTIAGTIVFNSRTGHIIRADQKPDSIAVTVRFDPADEGSAKTRTFHVARSRRTPVDIMREVRALGQLRYGTAVPLIARMVATVEGQTPIRWQDTLVNWNTQIKTVDSFEHILNWTLQWTQPRPRVDALEFVISASSAELYEPQAYQVTPAEETITIELVIRRERDYRGMTRTFGPFPKQALAGKLFIGSGDWFGRYLLTNVPLQETGAAFDGTINGASLYLVVASPENHSAGNVGAVPTGYRPVESRMTLRIIQRLTEEDVVVGMKGNLPVEVSLEEKKE